MARHAVTSSTLPADPPSNETIDVFYIKMAGTGTTLPGTPGTKGVLS